MAEPRQKATRIKCFTSPCGSFGFDVLGELPNHVTGGIVAGNNELRACGAGRFAGAHLARGGPHDLREVASTGGESGRVVAVLVLLFVPHVRRFSARQLRPWNIGRPEASASVNRTFFCSVLFCLLFFVFVFVFWFFDSDDCRYK